MNASDIDARLAAAAEELVAGRPVAAEMIYRDILADAPAHPLTNLALGDLLMRTARMEEAEAFIRRAVDANPKDIQALFRLARLLLETRRFEASLGAFEALAAIDQSHMEIYSHLGMLYARFGRADEAEVSFRRAIELAPGAADPYTNLATLYGQTGRFDDAAEMLERVLEIEPDNVAALAKLAVWRKFTAADATVETMLRLYSSGEMSDRDRVRLGFALGKAFEDIGDYPRAFGFWQEGNALRRRIEPYGLDAALDALRAMQRIFTSGFIAERKIDETREPAPIFIIGMPRSGTTLVEQVLSAHSAVHGGGELEHLRDICRDACDDYPADLANLDGPRWRDIAARYTGVLRDIAGGAAFVTDKLPMNFINVGIIRVSFPNARIVHCTRDPVETCLSCFKQDFGSDEHSFSCDLEDLGRYYNAYRELMRHWDEAAPGAMYEVNYERLVTDFDSEVRRLLAHCELPFEEACVDMGGNRRLVSTASAWQVRQGIYRDSLQRSRQLEEQLAPLRQALDAG